MAKEIISFPTQFTNKSEPTSPTGDPYAIDYAYKIDEKTGTQNLVIVGKTDRQAMIDADRDACDINKLMERFTLGDESALDVVKGAYIDVTDMPKTYAEMFERNIECIQKFDKLPADLKDMFNNSYTEYWTEFDTPQFYEKYAKYNERFNTSPQYDSDPISDVKNGGDVIE